MPKEFIIVIAAGMTIVFLLFLILFFSVVRIWFQGLLSGVAVSIHDVIGMRLRRVPPALIVHAAIILRHRGEMAPVAEVESCFLGYGSNSLSANELADLVLEQRAKLAPSTSPKSS
jgi:uncharacterized protein YqfA (UPF0365 family)